MKLKNLLINIHLNLFTMKKIVYFYFLLLLTFNLNAQTSSDNNPTKLNKINIAIDKVLNNYVGVTPFFRIENSETAYYPAYIRFQIINMISKTPESITVLGEFKVCDRKTDNESNLTSQILKYKAKLASFEDDYYVKEIFYYYSDSSSWLKIFPKN